MPPLDIQVGSVSFKIPDQDTQGRPIGSNRILALATQSLKYYSDRLAAQVDAVKQDTDRLNSLQATLNNMATWTSANWKDDPIGHTALLNSEAVDLSGVTQRVSALVSSEQTNSRLTVQTNIRTGQHFDLAAVGDSPNAPDDAALQFDQGKYFFQRPGVGRIDVDHVQMYVVAPTDAQIDGWRKQVAARADQLTQTSQAKQAFLQDLATSVQSFLLFTTNAEERSERTRQSILDHMA